MPDGWPFIPFPRPLSTTASTAGLLLPDADNRSRSASLRHSLGLTNSRQVRFIGALSKGGWPMNAAWYYEPWFNGDDASWVIFRFSSDDSEGFIEACTEPTSEIEVNRHIGELDQGKPLELPIEFTTRYHPDAEVESDKWEDLFGAGVFRQVVGDEETSVEVGITDELLEEQICCVLNGWQNADSTLRLFRAVAPGSFKSVADSLVVGTKLLTWQSISIDEDKRQIRIYGKPLKINRLQEFQLIRELLQARGRTVPHGVLRLKIRSRFGTAHPTNTAPANVNSVIQRVRVALLELGYEDCIKSTKGEGFRLDI